MSDICVHIRYFNVLADYAGTRRAEVRVPEGTTVRDLLKHVSETGSEAFRRALANADALDTYLRVFRNDRMIIGDVLDAPLADGDVISIFPAIAGG